MKLDSIKPQIALLSLLQALLFTNNVTLIAVTGLAGMALVENKLFATLPVTAYVLGSALAVMPAAQWMRRFGRRAGYSIGAGAAALGAVLASQAMSQHSLALLCIATLITGIFNAFGQSYRFAAADVADAYQPSFRARAISLVVSGGIVGGILGPELSKLTRDLLPVQFAGTYLSLAGFALLTFSLAQLLRLPVNALAASAGPVRPLATILRQPNCWVAVLTAMLSFGVMNLLMVATPMAMAVCSHPYAAAATVIEWHVIGMFAPGFVTGSLISRFGVLPVIAAGSALMLICAAFALSGLEVRHFLVALTVLGVGWNLMYVGATTLLTTSYRPQEKNKVQGFNDFCVFTTQITSSLSSGVLLYANGWNMLVVLSLPFVVLVLLATAWLAARTSWRFGAMTRGS